MNIRTNTQCLMEFGMLLKERIFYSILAEFISPNVNILQFSIFT